MGFFSGRMTCVRFRFTGPPPRIFSEDHTTALDTFAIGKEKIASSDGSSAGWIAGDHILDLNFHLAKNIVNDTLHFALRMDSQAIPNDLLRAYTQVELEAIAAENPSGHPSNRQRREARDSARDRLEAEAADGRFLKRKSAPILWDAQTNEVLVGTTSVTLIDRFLNHFLKTFDHGLELLGAGRQAYLLAEARNQTRGVDDAKIATYVPGKSASEVAWAPDDTTRDFLGNEFLLWLWYLLDTKTDTVPLADDSEVAVMLTRTLNLECPRGQTGKDSIAADGPTQLPEAKRAIQAGKLPRKVGLILVRHEQQYELTLQAENLAINAARFPAPEGDNDQAIRENRVSQIRHLLETLDLLYDAFGNVRFGGTWPQELQQIQQWLMREDRGKLPATG
ncbi:MAG: hypothetical protein ACFCD0_19960 [Gemmataceae bacterium]